MCLAAHELPRRDWTGRPVPQPHQVAEALRGSSLRKTKAAKDRIVFSLLEGLKYTPSLDMDFSASGLANKWHHNLKCLLPVLAQPEEKKRAPIITIIMFL